MRSMKIVSPQMVAPQPDGIDGKTRRRHTAQLLCLGTSLAIFGLSLSLILLIFNVNCNRTFLMGVSKNTPSGTEMCKQSTTSVTVPSDLSVTSIQHNHVVSVTGTSCKTDADCVNVKSGDITLKAFCVGGQGKISEPDYCSTNSCACSTVVNDCQVTHKVQWQYMPSEFTLQCYGPACTTNQTLEIPLWKVQRSLFLGCERYRKSSLHDIMVAMQTELETRDAFPLLKPAADAAWFRVQAILGQTPDVNFGSFWPSTISESVANSLSNEAKIFLGFMLCAALCQLKSEYTFEVESVDLMNLKSPMVLSWNMIRSFFPPMGLILLAMVPMKPTSQIFDLTDATMTLVHLTGAQFCFVVYLMCEFAALMDADNIADMRGNEWIIRLTLTIIGGFAMVMFALCYGILNIFNGSLLSPFVNKPFGGTSDWFEVDDMDQANLIRPAQGGWRMIKVLSYFAEYIVALSILINLAVINHYFYKYKVRKHVEEEPLIDDDSDDY